MLDKYFDILKSVIGSDANIETTLFGGMMNEAYIVSSKKGKFIFYISTKQANEMVNRRLEKETQNIAYELNLTSENIYFDLESGIKINRYIEGDSINHVDDFDYEKIADLLAKFHSSKKLASEYYDPLSRLEKYRKEAENFVDKFDDRFYSLYEYIFSNKNYLLSQKVSLAHNDAQRSNIIKSLDNIYYLIDFEFSANNDPIYDVATFGNQDVNEGKKLLEIYEKKMGIKDGLKRYSLWRIDISLQWYLVALIKHYRGEGKVHNIDFLSVANHFLNNAIEAKKLLN